MYKNIINKNDNQVRLCIAMYSSYGILLQFSIINPHLQVIPSGHVHRLLGTLYPAAIILL